MPSIRVPAFAKVNLRLDVLGRRADGYHELRTIFQSLSLHDTLVLGAPGNQASNCALQATLRWLRRRDSENLVWRARGRALVAS